MTQHDFKALVDGIKAHLGKDDQFNCEILRGIRRTF